MQTRMYPSGRKDQTGASASYFNRKKYFYILSASLKKHYFCHYVIITALVKKS